MTLIKKRRRNSNEILTFNKRASTKGLLLVLYALMSFFSDGQVIYGSILDQDGDPLPDVQVTDTLTKKTIEPDANGTFIYSFTESCVLNVSHPNYESQFFSFKMDTDSIVRYIFRLENRFQLVSGVVVSSERMKTVVDQKNMNVIDYLPYDNVILTLKSYKNERILSIEGSDTTYTSFYLGKIKPKEIFLDCFNNIHLLSNDSAYQVWMDGSLEVISRSSRKEFDKVVKPCIADFEESKVFENFTNSNKKYSLTEINQASKRRYTFFRVEDQVGESVAKEIYDSIVRLYFKVTPDYANIITAGAWSGDVMELVSLDHGLHYLISWYVKIRTAELNIQSFQSGNRLYTIDQYSDSVLVFDNYCNLITSKSYSFRKSKRIFDVVHDRSNHSFYEVILTNGVFSIIEVPLESEKEKRQIEIKEAPFCKNIKVHDDWVYFMVKQNDFYQINRIYLGGS